MLTSRGLIAACTRLALLGGLSLLLLVDPLLLLELCLLPYHMLGTHQLLSELYELLFILILLDILHQSSLKRFRLYFLFQLVQQVVCLLLELVELMILLLASPLFGSKSKPWLIIASFGAKVVSQVWIDAGENHLVLP